MRLSCPFNLLENKKEPKTGFKLHFYLYKKTNYKVLEDLNRCLMLLHAQGNNEELRRPCFVSPPLNSHNK